MLNKYIQNDMIGNSLPIIKKYLNKVGLDLTSSNILNSWAKNACILSRKIN